MSISYSVRKYLVIIIIEQREALNWDRPLFVGFYYFLLFSSIF
jgi:hypothetical protein